jgi:superfamily II DNA/RNA helicase
MAMAPPLILKQICSRLLFREESTLIINIGNDWPNLTMVMCLMRGAARDLGALDYVLDEALAGGTLKRTVIFFNSRELCLQGFKYLRIQLPEARRHEINYLHALRTQDAKHDAMENFQWGKTRILCATEAAGMVSPIYHLSNPSLKYIPGHGYF